jgi:hypothetical protein
MMQQTRNKKLFVIGGLLLVMVVVLLLLSFKKPAPKQSNSSTRPKTTSYTDPTSHQTVVNQQGKAPETNGTTQNGPIFLGFSSLINMGISLQQVNALQAAFTAYQPFSTDNTQISLAVDDLQQIDPTTSKDPQGRWSIKSHVVVNQKDTYQVTFYYDGISSVQLHIYNSQGNQQVFDSGIVDSTSANTQSPDD